MDSNVSKPIYVNGGQTTGRINVNREEGALTEASKDDLPETVQPLVALPVDKSKIPHHNPPLKESFHFDRYYNEGQKELVSKLPITSFRNQIVDAINLYQVTIITGSTGCGKTTQVPQYIMDYHASKHSHCNIIVLQPRKLSAVAVAERVCMEKGWPVGSLCGYKIGLTDKTSDDTRLLYVTTGIFLQMLLHEKSVNRFTHILFDEIHDREKEMDFSLMIVKKYLATNSPNTKLILMSATVESDKFANFFSTKVDGIDIPAPIIEVDAPPPHEVQHFYLDDLAPLGRLPELNMYSPKVTKEFLELGIRLMAQFDLLDYHTEHKLAVLVFLPGIADIEEMYKLMNNQLNSGCGSYKWQIHVLHSMVPPDDQQKAFRFAPRGHRKIILSTNIAESSITIPDISIVIDYCLTKILTANCQNNTTKLISVWASKANLTQRYGRVGRVGKGLVYRMITKAAMETKVVNYNPPDMKRCLLEKVVVQTIHLGIGDPAKFLSEALDPPDEEDVKKTILILKAAGAIRLRARIPYSLESLNSLGRLMAVMPLDPRFTRMITLGYLFSVFKESIIIAACMSTRGVLVNEPFNKMKAYKTKLIWANGSQSDSITLLNVYQTWKRHLATGYFRRTHKNTEGDWASKYDVNLKGLYEADKLALELTDRFKKYNIEEVEGPEKVVWTDIEREFVQKIMLAGASYPNYFRRPVSLGDTFEQIACHILSGGDPFTTTYFKGFPPHASLKYYEDKIRKFMSECGENFKVYGDGHDSVFLEFPRNKEPEIHPDVPLDPRIPGGISLGVYKAHKMKLIRRHLELPFLGPNEIGKIEEQLRAKERREKLQGEVDCISKNENIQGDGPPTNERSFPVKISHVVNPGQFWCIALDDKAKEYQNRLNKELDSIKEKLQLFRKPPKVGQWCIVKTNSEENVLYRGKIVRLDASYGKTWKATVYLIDTGATKLFKSYNVMKYNICLWNSTKEIPCLAFECTLAKVRPSPLLSVREMWTQEATNEFKKITNDGDFFVEKYSVVSGLTSVFLMKCLPEQNYNLCINESMVDMDYAVDCVERWNSEIKLKGPSSPLAMNLVAYTESKMNWDVSTSPQSVNSVLLNAYPRDTHEGLMVAGTVSEGYSDTSLTLSETTMMPNIPGWSSLIPLIFSPATEIRTNKDGTAYAGAICGLGLDEEGNPIFPENDMKLYFDTVFAEEDLIDINRLRFAASAMLVPQFYDDNMCSLSDRQHFKRIIQECVRNLFLKKKTVKTVEAPACSLNWQTDPNAKHWTQDFVEQFDGMLMYRAHRPRKLFTTSEKKVILDRLEFLHDLVDNRKEWWEALDCEICKEQFDTVEALGVHFSTRAHKEQEDELKQEFSNAVVVKK